MILGSFIIICQSTDSTNLADNTTDYYTESASSTTTTFTTTNTVSFKANLSKVLYSYNQNYVKKQLYQKLIQEEIYHCISSLLY